MKLTDCYDDVGDGWAAILTMLHNELMQVAPEYEAAQVKEKFGGLRAYLDLKNVPKPYQRLAYDLERKYEALSNQVCELCGKLGVNRENARHWWMTRCDECFTAGK